MQMAGIVQTHSDRGHLHAKKVEMGLFVVSLGGGQCPEEELYIVIAKVVVAFAEHPQCSYHPS